MLSSRWPRYQGHHYIGNRGSEGEESGVKNVGKPKIQSTSRNSRVFSGLRPGRHGRP